MGSTHTCTYCVVQLSSSANCSVLTHSLTHSPQTGNRARGGVETQEARPMPLDVSVQEPKEIVKLVQRQFLCSNRLLRLEGAQVQSGLGSVMGDVKDIRLPVARGRHRLPKVVCTPALEFERSVRL